MFCIPDVAKLCCNEDNLLFLFTAESRVDKPDEDADKHMSGDTLLCRDDEIASLEAFLKRHIVGKRPGSLYVSGPPGTGKSASVNHVIRNKVVCLCA